MRRLASLLLAIFPACSGTEVDPPPPADWKATVLFETEGKLGGCATGDVYPERPGAEAVAVSSAGRVIVASRVDGAWADEVVLEAPGELIQVAVGDLLTDFPGEEIVAGGMSAGGEDDGGPGALWLLWRDPTLEGWQALQALTPSALVHAVLVGDVDPQKPGLEAVSAGFDNAVTMLNWSAWPKADSQLLGMLPDAAKGIAEWDGGIAVACADGTLHRLDRDGESWRGSDEFNASSGLARLAGDGSRLLASSNDGTLYLFERAGDDVTHEVVFEEPGAIKGRGAMMADLNPERAGLELGTGGYSGKVHLPFRGAEGWDAVAIYDDGQKLHHVAAGDLVPEVDGDEVIAGGYAGRLVLLERAP